MPKTLTKSTLAQYKAKLSRLAKLGVTDYTDFANVLSVIKSISDNFNTQRTYLQAVSHQVPSVTEYHNHIKLLSTASKEQEKTNELTEKQLAAYIPWEQILTVRSDFSNKLQVEEKLREQVPGKYRRKLPYKHLLLLSLYTCIEPRRIQDYLLMYCCKTRPAEKIDKEINYYIESEKKFIFYVYKTAKYYGTQEVDIPNDLFKVMDDYFKVYDIQSGDSFLGYTREENLSEAIGDLFLELTNKRVTVDLIRHAYSTYRHKQDPTYKEREEYSKKMGHSVKTDLLYVKKET